jgi:hypothetical protein
MTDRTDRDFLVQQLERYLDEYEPITDLPARVRASVHAEIRRKQYSPPGLRRYLIMASTRIVPVAIAAAVVVAVAAYLLIGGNVGSRTVPSSSPTPTSLVACDATRVGADRPGTINVDWCSAGAGNPGKVSLSMEAPAAWINTYYADPHTLWLRPAGGGAIAFDARTGETVEHVVTSITTNTASYAVSNRRNVVIGGEQAVVLDVSLADGASSGSAPALITESGQTWPIQAGTFSRVWVVAVDDRTIMIAAGEQLADQVENALKTLTWGA